MKIVKLFNAPWCERKGVECCETYNPCYFLCGTCKHSKDKGNIETENKDNEEMKKAIEELKQTEDYNLLE